MLREIREQPEVYRRILRDGWDPIRQTGEAIRQRTPRFVVLIARGTSDHAALYGKYLVETRLGLPAGLASPSSTTVYEASQRMEGVLLVAISQSGSSPDVVVPTEKARASGAVTVAITNDSRSALARSAEYHLSMLAGDELAVAATKTYTAELLVLFLLTETLAGRDASATARLPERAEAALALEGVIQDLAPHYASVDLMLATSRGYNLPTALEISLKLVEAAGIASFAFSGADLIHGPLAMIERGTPVILVVPDGPARVALRPVVEALEERRADVLLVGNVEEIFGHHAQLPILDLGAECLSPLLTILPLQLLALHLGLRRGHDPDHPAGLSKVTRTW